MFAFMTPLRMLQSSSSDIVKVWNELCPTSPRPPMSAPIPAWQLSWVRVTNLTTWETALFPADSLWLGQPGGSAWRELAAAWPGGVAIPPKAAKQMSTLFEQACDGSGGGALPVYRPASDGAAAACVATAARRALLSAYAAPGGYRVTFWTSSILGAGTAARVFFEIIGAGGSSGVVYLDTGPAARGCRYSAGGGGFERGGTASTLFPRLPHLGELRQLRVGTDGSGAFAPWHLRRAEVEHAASGVRWGFDCHAWLNRHCDYQRILTAVTLSQAEV
jgi:hypothetical protein